MGRGRKFIVVTAILLGCGDDPALPQNSDVNNVRGDGDESGDGDGDAEGDGDGDLTEGDGDDEAGDGDVEAGDGDTEGDGDSGDGDAGDGDAPVEPGTEPSKLPKPKGNCANLKNGTFSMNGATVELTVGTKPGPVYFYFHGTGSSPSEVDSGIPGARSGVKTKGGIVATWDKSSGMGESTGSVWKVWHTGDFDVADEILACGIEKGIVDTSHIHAAGYSAGGLQTGAMVFMRSNYLASAIVYSGGKGFGASSLQDKSNTPSVVLAHGKKGADNFIIDFANSSAALEKELLGLKDFVIDCEDSDAHVSASRLGIQDNALAFFESHGYKQKPYSKLSGWPNYCAIAK